MVMKYLNKNNYSLELFGINIFSMYYDDRFGWFRLLGKGLKFKDVTVHNLIFSERNGYKKFIKIKNWIISYLK